MSGGGYELRHDLNKTRTTSEQKRGAAKVMAGYCLRQTGLRPGEPLADLPEELRAMARADLVELLAALVDVDDRAELGRPA
jgi:hypothetical protein